ncbi:hypothetical protein P7C70_g1599, partial [Phenoliferia sp. Uapishka_3]
MPSNELIPLLTPLPSLVLTTLISTTETLSALIEQALEENVGQLAREICGVTGGAQVDAVGRNVRDRDNWGVVRAINRLTGKDWEESESGYDELLDPNLKISDALIRPAPINTEPHTNGNPNSRPPGPTHQFSSFALSSHLSAPSLRLVYLSSSFNVELRSIPGFPPEGVRKRWWVGHSSNAKEVVEGVVEALGVKKVVLGGKGVVGGRLEFVLLPHLENGFGSPIPYAARLSSVSPPLNSSSTLTLTLSEKTLAKLGLPLVVTSTSPQPSVAASGSDPPGWRPTSIFGSLWSAPATTGTSSASTEPSTTSEDSNHCKISPTPVTPPPPPASNLASEDEDDEQSEPTLKGASPRSNPSTAAATSRLSALFSPWTEPVADSDPASKRRTRMVSGPVPIVESHEEASKRFSSWTPGMRDKGKSVEELLGEEEAGEEDLETELEGLMDELGMKAPQRAAMRQLPLDRQRFLISQHRSSTPAPHVAPLRPSKTGPSETSTGTGALANLKRFSLWGAPAEAPPVPSLPSPPTSPVKLSHVTPHSTGGSNGRRGLNLQPVEEDHQSWSSWWSAASNATGNGTGGNGGGAEVAKDTPRFYVDQLRSTKISQRSLVKHLIALRVRLSTAKVAWTEEFLGEATGLDALEELLGKITLKRVHRKEQQSDEDETVQGECIKCLRVLLNTDLGFTTVLSHQLLITYIAYSLLTPSHKLRSLVADVLAALCVLSLHDGHRIVLAALSDLRVVAPDEKFRFETLVESIRLKESADEDESEEGRELGDDDEEEMGLWEWRTAAMSLVNALVNSPDELEERIALREEFTRRGLNEVMASLRYVQPPDTLLTQLNLYSEERQEDLDEVQERASGRTRGSSDPRVSELVRLAGEHYELYPLFLDVCTKFAEIYDNPEVDAVFRSDLMNVIESFINQSSALESFEGWATFLKTFLSSVEPITGVYELQTIGHSSSKQTSTDQGDKEPSFGSVFERVLDKEHEVAELQAEVARLRSPSLDGEAKKERGERNRYYESLLEEKRSQALELETSVEARDKEIKYLKRALESVYSRFRATVAVEAESTAVAESVVDAEDMATRSIEALAQRDKEIATLQVELALAKAEIAAQLRLPKAFARRAPAPPPPTLPSTALSPPQTVIKDSFSTPISSSSSPDSTVAPPVAVPAPSVVTVSVPIPISSLHTPPPPP